MPPTERTAAAAAVAAVAAAWLTAAAAAGPIGDTVAAAFGPDGRLWRATPTKDGLLVDSSADLGRTFTAPVRVGERRQRLRATAEDRPSIAVDGRGRVYVVFAADARQPWTRYATVSTDDGHTFAPPVALSSRAGEVLQYEPALAASTDGARVLWMEDEGQSGHGTLFFGTLDAGHWRTPDRVALHDAMCECCRIAAATTPAGETIAVARLVVDGRLRDIGLVRVGADGNPGRMQRVTDDAWEINACPEHGPALAVSASGRYHIAWFTLGSRRQGLFRAWSDDSGAALSPPVAVGAPGSHAGHADLAAQGREVAIVWQQFDGRATVTLEQVSADDGATFGPAREVGRTTGNADFARVLTNGRAFYVSWYTHNEGFRLIPLAGGP